MTILIGTILSQPKLRDGLLSFRLETGNRILTVLRVDPKDQKLDILFLCSGQQIFLWGYGDSCRIFADGIRILRCEERNYTTTETIKNGVMLYGDSADTGTDTGDSEL